MTTLKIGDKVKCVVHGDRYGLESGKTYIVSVVNDWKPTPFSAGGQMVQVEGNGFGIPAEKLSRTK